MKRRAAIVVLAVVALAMVAGVLGAAMKPAAAAVAPAVRFMAVDVFVDSGSAPLAAWQVEARLGAGAKLAGVEGGEAGVFADAPTYDPAALMNERVIIAAFSLEDAAKLPSGRVRVARLHLELGQGAATDAEAVQRFEAVVQAAADAQGKKFEAAATLAPVAMDEGSGGDQ